MDIAGSKVMLSIEPIKPSSQLRHLGSADICQPEVYFFGWPSHVGGADTKLAHLLRLLSGHCRITVVPNQASQLEDSYWRTECERWGAHCCLFEELPVRLAGSGVALCNGRFFPDRIAHRAKERGLRIIWSGEMMWPHPGETESIQAGVVDRVLYVCRLCNARP